jgi:hypothetical protein
MRENDQIFDGDDIVEYSDWEEFNKIPTGSLMDFLPRIYPSEMWILESWKNYFESIGTPFAISEHKTKYSDRSVTHFALWKIRRI